MLVNKVSAGGSAAPIKPKRAPKQKTPRILDTRQATMFNEGGYRHFNPDIDARPLAGLPGRYMVGAMLLELSPPPSDSSKALVLTMDSLSRVHFARSEWRYFRPMAVKPMTIDSWKCKTCAVSFRSRTDDGVIRATYSRSDKLELSLPHMLMWQSCGLSWLGGDHDCCRRNESNPTPWLGRSCGCP